MARDPKAAVNMPGRTNHRDRNDRPKKAIVTIVALRNTVMLESAVYVVPGPSEKDVGTIRIAISEIASATSAATCGERRILADVKEPP